MNFIKIDCSIPSYYTYLTHINQLIKTFNLNGRHYATITENLIIGLEIITN